jgi:hypothetical protein
MLVAVLVAACGRVDFDPVVTACGNAIRDGDETGIDCGGSCLPCVGAPCSDGSMCATGSCVGGQCELASGPPYWLPGPALGTPRGSTGCAADGTGTIAVAGGDDSATILNTTELLGPGATAFTPGPPMQIARTSHAVAATIDGTVYAFGGGSPSASTSLEALTAGAWSSRSSSPMPHNGVSGAGGLDSLLYFVDTANLLIYSPATDSWSMQAAPSNSRDSAGAVRGPDARIYAIGGRSPANVTLDFVDAWDTQLLAWQALAPLKTPRNALSVVAAGDGRIYAIAGTVPSGANTNSVEAYALDRDRWIDVAPLALARVGACAAVGTDGRIYLIGGYGPDPQSSVEVYGPVLSLSASGTTVVVSGTNFAANAGVAITFDGTLVANGVTDAAGAVSATFVVPAAATGAHLVRGIDDRSQFPTTAQLQLP